MPLVNHFLKKQNKNIFCYSSNCKGHFKWSSSTSRATQAFPFMCFVPWDAVMMARHSQH